MNRAEIKTTSDMTGLLSILPSKARLVVDGSIVEVPCNSLSVGDQLVVLPGVSEIDLCFNQFSISYLLVFLFCDV